MRPDTNTLTVVADIKAPSENLTLLIDPSAKPHANLDWLPTKAITVMFYNYQDIMKNFSIDFVLASILIEKQDEKRKIFLLMPRMLTDEQADNLRFVNVNSNKFMIKEVNKLSPLQLSKIIINEGWLSVNVDEK
jgi:hypothetical protein